MGTLASKVTVVFELDEEGWWAVSVPEVQGCRTQAQTLEAGRRRIREALEAATGERRWSKSVELVDDVRLPVTIQQTIAVAAEARRIAEAAQAKASAALTEAAVSLARLERSTRDSGELLGISQQRVAQVLAIAKAGRKAGPASKARS